MSKPNLTDPSGGSFPSGAEPNFKLKERYSENRPVAIQNTRNVRLFFYFIKRMFREWLLHIRCRFPLRPETQPIVRATREWQWCGCTSSVGRNLGRCTPSSSADCSPRGRRSSRPSVGPLPTSCRRRCRRRRPPRWSRTLRGSTPSRPEGIPRPGLRSAKLFAGTRGNPSGGRALRRKLLSKKVFSPKIVLFNLR